MADKPLLITHDIAVATYDIDFAGHVSNIAYLRWLEDMRLKLFEEHFPLERFMQDGLAPVLVSTEIHYKRPIGLFDRPRAFMWVPGITSASLTIQAELKVADNTTTLAKHLGVFIDMKSGKPVRLPSLIRQCWQSAVSQGFHP